MSIAFVDGGCSGNNDKAAVRSAYGSYKIIQEDGQVIHAARFDLESAKTNNQAEYSALIRLLDDPHLSEGSVILTDSQLLIGHLENHHKVKAPQLRPLYQQAVSLLRKKRAVLRQVPRAEIVAQLGH